LWSRESWDKYDESVLSKFVEYQYPISHKYSFIKENVIGDYKIVDEILGPRRVLGDAERQHQEYMRKEEVEIKKIRAKTAEMEKETKEIRERQRRERSRSRGRQRKRSRKKQSRKKKK
jgi:hypothetical protein